jgi:glycosyltransferase involved in cell wall biosynthesis
MVTPRFHPFTGGVETHVHEVASRLAARGFDVTVVTADITRKLPRRDERQGVSVRRFPATPWLGDLQWAPGIFGAVAGGGWDIVHVQCIHTLVPPLAMAAAGRVGLPYVVSFHTGGHSSGLRNAFRPLQWRLQRPLLRRAAALVAVSDFEARLFERALGLGHERFAVIRNGFEMPESSLAEEPGPVAEAGGPVILSIGRLERYKGHHRAIGAMGAVLRAHPGAELYVVGSGPYERQLRRLADAAGAGSHVHFTTFPPERRAELRRLMVRSDLIALLSEYEAHPVSVMEAAGLGLRVLVGATSGLHELAVQGLATEVSLGRGDDEIGALMVELLRRPAPEAAPELPTWDACAGRLADLYLAALSPARAPAR